MSKITKIREKLNGLVVNNGHIWKIVLEHGTHGRIVEREDLTDQFDVKILPHHEGSKYGGYVLTVSEGDDCFYFDHTAQEWWDYKMSSLGE